MRRVYSGGMWPKHILVYNRFIIYYREFIGGRNDTKMADNQHDKVQKYRKIYTIQHRFEIFSISVMITEGLL